MTPRPATLPGERDLERLLDAISLFEEAGGAAALRDLFRRLRDLHTGALDNPATPTSGLSDAELHGMLGARFAFNRAIMALEELRNEARAALARTQRPGQ